MCTYDGCRLPRYDNGYPRLLLSLSLTSKSKSSSAVAAHESSSATTELITKKRYVVARTRKAKEGRIVLVGRHTTSAFHSSSLSPPPSTTASTCTGSVTESAVQSAHFPRVENTTRGEFRARGKVYGTVCRGHGRRGAATDSCGASAAVLCCGAESQSNYTAVVPSVGNGKGGACYSCP